MRVGAFLLPLLLKKTAIHLPQFHILKTYQASGITIVSNENMYNEEKPDAVWLPGIDSSSLTAIHHKDLNDHYNMYYIVKDESCVEYDPIIESLRSFLNEKKNVTLFGESFGGVIGIGLMDHINVDLGVFINPATSYYESFLPSEIANILQRGEHFFRIRVLAMILNNSPSTKELSCFINDKCIPMMYMLYNLLIIDKETFLNRLKLLEDSIIKIQDTIVEKPMIIVAGEFDNFLPSVAEAYRLQGKHKNVQVIITKSSHMLTQSVMKYLKD
jgi:pimeloyl-ACP methyl ester carboxylesterase